MTLLQDKVVDQCRLLLALGAETTRNLALYTGASRALIATWLHGEPGITREGDTWAMVVRRPPQQPPSTTGGKLESAALTYLRSTAGWHNYADIAQACGLEYSSVAQSLARSRESLYWSKDSRGRALVAWKGAA